MSNLNSSNHLDTNNSRQNSLLLKSVPVERDKEYSIYFTSSKPKELPFHQLEHVNLNMFVINSENKLSLLSNSQINELQTNLRKEYSSYSNVYILNLVDTRGYYNCIYYPIILKFLIPETLNTEIDKQYMSNLTYFLLNCYETNNSTSEIQIKSKIELNESEYTTNNIDPSITLKDGANTSSSEDTDKSTDGHDSSEGNTEHDSNNGSQDDTGTHTQNESQSGGNIKFKHPENLTIDVEYNPRNQNIIIKDKRHKLLIRDIQIQKYELPSNISDDYSLSNEISNLEFKNVYFKVGDGKQTYTITNGDSVEIPNKIYALYLDTTQNTYKVFRIYLHPVSLKMIKVGNDEFNRENSRFRIKKVQKEREPQFIIDYIIYLNTILFKTQELENYELDNTPIKLDKVEEEIKKANRYYEYPFCKFDNSSEHQDRFNSYKLFLVQDNTNNTNKYFTTADFYNVEIDEHFYKSYDKTSKNLIDRKSLYDFKDKYEFEGSNFTEKFNNIKSKIENNENIKLFEVGMTLKGDYGMVFFLKKKNGSEKFVLKIQNFSSKENITDDEYLSKFSSLNEINMMGHILKDNKYALNIEKCFILPSDKSDTNIMCFITERLEPLSKDKIENNIVKDILKSLYENGVSIFVDFKTENIMLDSNKQYKYIDLGPAYYIFYNAFITSEEKVTNKNYIKSIEKILNCENGFLDNLDDNYKEQKYTFLLKDFPIEGLSDTWPTHIFLLDQLWSPYKYFLDKEDLNFTTHYCSKLPQGMTGYAWHYTNLLSQSITDHREKYAGLFNSRKNNMIDLLKQINPNAKECSKFKKEVLKDKKSTFTLNFNDCNYLKKPYYMGRDVTNLTFVYYTKNVNELTKGQGTDYLNPELDYYDTLYYLLPHPNLDSDRKITDKAIENELRQLNYDVNTYNDFNISRLFMSLYLVHLSIIGYDWDFAKNNNSNEIQNDNDDSKIYVLQGEYLKPCLINNILTNEGGLYFPTIRTDDHWNNVSFIDYCIHNESKMSNVYTDTIEFIKNLKTNTSVADNSDARLKELQEQIEGQKAQLESYTVDLAQEDVLIQQCQEALQEETASEKVNEVEAKRERAQEAVEEALQALQAQKALHDAQGDSSSEESSDEEGLAVLQQKLAEAQEAHKAVENEFDAEQLKQHMLQSQKEAAERVRNDLNQERRDANAQIKQLKQEISTISSAKQEQQKQTNGFKLGYELDDAFNFILLQYEDMEEKIKEYIAADYSESLNSLINVNSERLKKVILENIDLPFIQKILAEDDYYSVKILANMFNDPNKLIMETNSFIRYEILATGSLMSFYKDFRKQSGIADDVKLTHEDASNIIDDIYKNYKMDESYSTEIQTEYETLINDKKFYEDLLKILVKEAENENCSLKTFSDKIKAHDKSSDFFIGKEKYIKYIEGTTRIELEKDYIKYINAVYKKFGSNYPENPPLYYFFIEQWDKKEDMFVTFQQKNFNLPGVVDLNTRNINFQKLGALTKSRSIIIELCRFILSKITYLDKIILNFDSIFHNRFDILKIFYDFNINKIRHHIWHIVSKNSNDESSIAIKEQLETLDANLFCLFPLQKELHKEYMEKVEEKKYENCKEDYKEWIKKQLTDNRKNEGYIKENVRTNGGSPIVTSYKDNIFHYFKDKCLEETLIRNSDPGSGSDFDSDSDE